MAGGGFQGVITYGATDDFGSDAIEKPVTIHDIHATILNHQSSMLTSLTWDSTANLTLGIRG